MTTRFLASLVLALSIAALAPRSSAAAQSLEVPRLAAPSLEAATPSPRVVHHVDRGLLIAGVTTLSIGWAANTVGAWAGVAGISMSEDVDNGDYETFYGLSLIPVAGPFVLAARALAAPSDGVRELVLACALVDGAVQALGLGLMIAGLVGVDDPLPEIAEGMTLTPVASSGFAGAVFQMDL